MSVTAYFVGPVDDENCDGCEDAADGNPYTIDDVPEPGSFECMSRCRHMVQLGEDAPDDIPTVDWSSSMGFTATDVAADRELGADDADVDDADAGDTDSDADDSDSDATNADDAQAGAGAIDDLADQSPEDIAQFLIDSGLTVDDIASDMADSDVAAVSSAFDDLSGSEAVQDVPSLLATGSADELADAFQDDDARAQGVQLGQDGFADADATQAYTLADALSAEGDTFQVVYRAGRWYVDET